MTDTNRNPDTLAPEAANATVSQRTSRFTRRLTGFRLTPLRTLLASAVVVAGMATVAVQAAPSGHEGCGHRAASARHDAGPDGMTPRMQGRMLERIGASAEQREQIRKIMASARADMKARRDDGKALRDKAAALMAQPTLDAAAVESLRKAMVERHDQASQRMTQAMLEAAQVLTPEQRIKLAEAMKDRRAGKGGHKHGDDKGHGAEGGPGHGHHGKEGERKAS